MHKIQKRFTYSILALSLIGLAGVGCDNQKSGDAELASLLTLIPAEEGLQLELPAQSVETGSDGYRVNLAGTNTYGETSGEDRGDCLLLCSKGNYNSNFKRNLCNSGRTAGVGTKYWFKGHFTYKGVKWDKMGTGQDHQGVCVAKPYGGASDTYVFHDGCTGYPDGNPRKMTRGRNNGWKPENWGQAFHAACVVHDLCYKAEPAFSGKSRSYCDDQMQINARKICYDSYGTGGGIKVFGRWVKKNDRDKCLAEAANARLWLRLGPKAHYEGYNYSFDWRPYYTTTNYSTGVITTRSGLCGINSKYDVNYKGCVYAAPRCTGGRRYSGGRCY